MNAHPRRFVLVLDDDPTGTQCASGVDVILRPGDVESALRRGDAAYVVTNTRAMSAHDAAALIGRVRHLAVHNGSGRDVELVLRGDSTLRGHVFAEMTSLGLDSAVGLVVPAYPAAGRITVGGVHYLTTSGSPVNVADTEFARDPVFGFRGRTIRDWVAETGGGGRPVESVGLEAVRHDGAAAIRDALLRTPDGGVVIPDVAQDADLGPIVAGLRAAQERGRTVVVRGAAPLASMIAGVPGRPVPAPPGVARRLLVVCGSHTDAATAQLEAIRDLTPPHLVVATDAVLGAGREDTVDAVVDAARRQLDRFGIAVVTTERTRRRDRRSLADGAAVMAGLMAVTRRLTRGVDAIVSKGGITSAEVATTGLGASVATVAGQIEVGISLWEVAGVPVAIVPGNIGDAQTLVRVLAYFSVG